MNYLNEYFQFVIQRRDAGDAEAQRVGGCVSVMNQFLDTLSIAPNSSQEPKILTCVFDIRADFILRIANY